MELAQLLDTSERPRAEGWSVRAALTRYAQPQPERACAIVALLRRTETALGGHTKRFEQQGPAVWSALQGGDTSTEVPAEVVALLRALATLDDLGEALAAWAVDRVPPRPDDLADTVVAEVSAQLEALGVPVEERPRPSGRRG